MKHLHTSCEPATEQEVKETCPKELSGIWTAYRIFSGLNGRGFAGEAAVPEGGEDVNPDNNIIIYRSSGVESIWLQFSPTVVSASVPPLALYY